METRTASAPPTGFDRLREHSIGLPQVLFQSITHMAPGAAIAFSILASVQFSGPALPLAVLFALIACVLVANSIGQLAKELPSAGGLYAYVTRALGPAVGFMVGWVFLALGLVVTAWMWRTRREALLNAGKVFVAEDELGAAPDVPPAPAPGAAS